MERSPADSSVVTEPGTFRLKESTCLHSRVDVSISCPLVSKYLSPLFCRDVVVDGFFLLGKEGLMSGHERILLWSSVLHVLICPVLEVLWCGIEVGNTIHTLSKGGRAVENLDLGVKS